MFATILRRLQPRLRNPHITLIPRPSLRFIDPDRPPGTLPPSSPAMAPKRKRAAVADAAPVDTNPDNNPAILDGKTALRASPDAEGKGEVLNVSKVVGDEHVALLDMDKELQVKPETPSKRGGVRTAASKENVKEEAESDLSQVNPGENGNGSPNGVLSKDFTEPGLEPTPKRVKRTPTKASKAAKKGADEIKAFIAEQAAQKAANGTATPESTPAKRGKGGKAAATKKTNQEDPDEAVLGRDPEADEPEEGEKEDVETEKKEAARPPPVNSDYLPLPWKGRLGYACLNTYLRFSTPPVFSSRTCRIQSILDHRHPLKDPSQPEHATKNRPDKDAPANVERGQRYVEEIGLANARDIVKMVRWNDKYGIKFMRLSSEMFPFASHEEYGYKLEPFAKETLAAAGKVAAELGHRLTTHPGQFTQLGSPRKAVIDNAIRDLEYHDELLSLLDLPAQQNRDAVMVLHLGGVFGDKQATIERFKQNYSGLSQSIKNRVVLENDDVSWSVHDLLPICEELNIPLVLDFHHHNIIFDADKLREGTKDIMDLFPRIKATWDKKGITQKMHYSEPTPQAITGRQRRKHNPRPFTFPPCPPDMDLMIEAKDKEQAVFEMMRNFRTPGWDTFNNIIPYERGDDNKPEPRKPAKKKKTKKQLKAEEEDPSLIEEEEAEVPKTLIAEDEVGMGGPENRVYWPPGMEEWLRPKKREIAKKKPQEEIDAEALAHPTPMNLELRKAAKQRLKEKAQAAMAAIGMDDDGEGGMTTATEDGAGTDGTTANTPTSTKAKGRRPPAAKAEPKSKASRTKGKKPAVKKEEEQEEDESAASSGEASAESSEDGAYDVAPSTGRGNKNGSRTSGRRAAANKQVSYVEGSPGAESDVDMV
ncbi:hypothetical protein QFC19_000694 [Naganishia cerealis]|uniref:Uncharacterized protein n=1 Tax=Naganishia cerealis TaxID=610337 RepID=A0ACC2WM83_9TREE|nr:hypothetical protein QFC19_000694 [Naganishia cerealis]